MSRRGCGCLLAISAVLFACSATFTAVWAAITIRPLP
jgi:hypothetical protein